MQGKGFKEMESGYLYYSLYSYRRKIEADIKRIIRSDNDKSFNSHSKVNKGNQEGLYELTNKLRNISLIISKLITLNKVYK